ILEDSAPKAISFPNLEDDADLFDWVQKGIPLHEGATECKFCTKELPKNRIANLNSFYSKKLKQIQDSIEETNNLIGAEKNIIDVKFPVKKDIAEPFQPEYEVAVKAYEAQKSVYKEKLSILEKDLKSKGSNIFTPIDATSFGFISLEKNFETLEGILKKHNDWVEEFGERKSAAVNKILRHYVAEYLKAEDYNQQESNKDCATQIIKKIEDKIATNLPLINNYNEQLSSTAKGQGELNEILGILLHR